MPVDQVVPHGPAALVDSDAGRSSLHEDPVPVHSDPEGMQQFVVGTYLQKILQTQASDNGEAAEAQVLKVGDYCQLATVITNDEVESSENSAQAEQSQEPDSWVVAGRVSTIDDMTIILTDVISLENRPSIREKSADAAEKSSSIARPIPVSGQLHVARSAVKGIEKMDSARWNALQKTRSQSQATDAELQQFRAEVDEQ